MKIGIIVLTLASTLLIGCERKEDAGAVACQKLSLDCTKNDKHWPLTFAIRKKAKEYLDLQEEQVITKLNSLDLKLSKFRKSTFDVNVYSHQSIELLLHPFALVSQEEKQKNQKLDNLAVFSAETRLLQSTFGHQPIIGVKPESNIQIKTDSKAYSRYQDIVKICEQSFVVDCRIAFKGRIDGVWTKKGEYSRELTGWIYLDEISVLNLDLENTKKSILVQVEKDALQMVYDLKGDVSWKQIEKLVHDRVSSIN